MYFGLLVFVGYMVVDTQQIIEKAHLGHTHPLYSLCYVSFVDSEYDDIK